MSWTQFYSEALTFAQATDDREYHTFTLTGATGAQLAVLATSPTARPTWWLAFRITILTEIEGLPITVQPTNAEVFSQQVPINVPTLLDLPKGIIEPFRVRLQVPFWYREMAIQIWQRGDSVQGDRQLLIAGAAGQNSFTLSFAPERPDLTELFINGVKATYGTEYEINGDTLTWLAPLSLDTTDEIEIFSPS